MEESAVSLGQLGGASKDFVRRLLTIGENRLELLAVEVQEGREKLLRSLIIALCIAVFGLLAGMTFSAAVVVIFWAISPLGVLLALTALYAIAAALLYQRFNRILAEWETMSATLDQLRKDRACLEKILS